MSKTLFTNISTNRAADIEKEIVIAGHFVFATIGRNEGAKLSVWDSLPTADTIVSRETNNRIKGERLTQG